MRTIPVYKCPDCGEYHVEDRGRVPDEILELAEHLSSFQGGIPVFMIRVPDLSEFNTNQNELQRLIDETEPMLGIHGPLL